MIFSLAAATAGFSQDLKPVPTPTPVDDPGVVKISTNLIQLDVTVTDSKGKVITDLRPDEIEIYENGKLQKTTNFSFVSSVRVETVADKPVDKNMPPGMPPPPVKPENVRRTIALVVDDLNLSFTSTYWVKQALKKFVNEQMQEGDLVAIIKTGTGIGTLQGFTTDKRLLLAAIGKVRYNMLGNAGVSSFNAIAPSLKEQLSGVGDRDFTEDIEDEREFERDVNEFRQSIFASGTLGAINYIVRGMMQLPGRKSIMMLSDGFSLVERSAGGTVVGTSRIYDQLRRLTDLANRASVVIYSIDPRGLDVLGLTAADDVSGLTGDQVSQRLSERRDEFRDSQDGLVYLSRETGGFAIINNNDIPGSIRRIMKDQSYYLVGYQPDDEVFDAKTRRFNKLEIKVTRKGARVRYRSGFFGISDEQVSKPSSDPAQALFNALTSPFAVNDVTLRLNALYSGRDKQGEYVKSFLHIDAKDLTFAEQSDGRFKTSFDVLAATYGDAGVAKDKISKNYTLMLTGADYDVIKRSGLVYDFTLLIKDPGAYQLRVAIRDVAANRVGSASQFVEIPNLKKGRLSLSGVMLQSTPYEEWQRRQMATGKTVVPADARADTAIRQFRSGTVVDYAVTIYNAKMDAARKTNLTVQAKLFNDQKQLFEGRVAPVERSETYNIAAVGSISLGSKLEPGNYTLQLIITDANAKKNRQTATQFVAFEMVK